MIQTVFIDQVLELARKANTGTEQPLVGLKIRTAQTLSFAYMTSGVVAAVAGWVSGKCVVKEHSKAPVLLIDAALDVTGSGSDTRYNAVWTAATLDGPTDGALRLFMGDTTAPKRCWCEVEWIDGTGTHSVSFPITLIPTLNDPEDEAPPPTDSASWGWLKQRAPDANGFTHDDSSKTLGVPSVAAQTTAALEKSQPVSADKIPLINSEASGALSWLSWSQLKANLKTYFDSLYSSASVAWSNITGKPSTFPPSSHSHAISDVTGLQGVLDAKIAASQRGANNGVAPLDSSGKVPSANLPSYVDDVIEAANLAALPGTGETSKIYVTLDTGKTYRWSGSSYVALNELPAFASQAEAQAGADNSKIMTPLRTAQAIAALATGGGEGINDPAVSYLSAEGNDSTGDGSAGAPFLTTQAAVDAGFRVLRAGVGSFGNVTITAPGVRLYLIGVGREKTQFGNFTMNGGAVIGNGRHMLTIGNVAFVGTPGSSANESPYVNGTGGNGGDGASVNGEVSGCFAAAISAEGGAGGDGGNGGPEDESNNSGNGGNGGAGGTTTLVIDDCEYSNASIRGGNGGNGGSSPEAVIYGQGNGGNGGDGGSAGPLTIRRSIETVGHENFGSQGGSGGSGVSSGTNGSYGGSGTVHIGPFSEVIGGYTSARASVISDLFVA